MKVISIDFDHVLHDAKRGFLNGELYGEPTEGAVWTLNNLAKEYTLVICTSRKPEDFKKIQEWLAKYGFPEMEVTNVKPIAKFYIDDRGLRFTNWADMSKYFL